MGLSWAAHVYFHIYAGTCFPVHTQNRPRRAGLGKIVNLIHGVWYVSRGVRAERAPLP